MSPSLSRSVRPPLVTCTAASPLTWIEFSPRRTQAVSVSEPSPSLATCLITRLGVSSVASSSRRSMVRIWCLPSRILRAKRREWLLQSTWASRDPTLKQRRKAKARASSSIFQVGCRAGRVWSNGCASARRSTGRAVAAQTFVLTGQPTPQRCVVLSLRLGRCWRSVRHRGRSGGGGRQWGRARPMRRADRWTPS